MYIEHLILPLPLIELSEVYDEIRKGAFRMWRVSADMQKSNEVILSVK